MDNTVFMGLLIGALAIIIPLFISCVTPIIKLNKTIQKLDDSIDKLNIESSRRDEKLTQLELNIAQHSQYLLMDKCRLDNHESRLHNIDHQEGYIKKQNS